MKCHVCGEPAVGQCQTCWKFYCDGHGNVFCQDCADLQAAARGPTQWMNVTAQTDEPDEDEKGEPLLSPMLVVMPELSNEELRRVVPVVQSQTRGDCRITIISIEVYDSGFAMESELRYVGRSSGLQGFARLMAHPEVSWSATDGKGRKYLGRPSAGHGDFGFWRGRTVFGPGLPPDANLLILSVEEVLWAAHNPGQRSRVQTGPWRFEVPLA